MQNDLAQKMQKVHDFESLAAYLRDTLRWPIPNDVEDITCGWSTEDLDLDARTQARVVYCQQLRLFNIEFDLSVVGFKPEPDVQDRQQLLVDRGILEDQQPWGIFFIQFDDVAKLDACKTLLRRMPRGLVDRRYRNASLPFWQHEKLLFICATTNFQNIGFACFSGGRKSRPIVNDYVPLIHFKLDT